MKADIHPHYRTVVFHDIGADAYFKIGSTIKTDREIELEGVTYPSGCLFRVAPVLHRQAEDVCKRGQHRPFPAALWPLSWR